MATTFTWDIADLVRRTSDGMIETVHYTVNASDESYSTGAYGSIGLEPAQPEDMVPFQQVTQETVVSWVKTHFGEEKVTEIEAALQG